MSSAGSYAVCSTKAKHCRFYKRQPTPFTDEILVPQNAPPEELVPINRGAETCLIFQCAVDEYFMSYYAHSNIHVLTTNNTVFIIVPQIVPPKARPQAYLKRLSFIRSDFFVGLTLNGQGAFRIHAKICCFNFKPQYLNYSRPTNDL